MTIALGVYAVGLLLALVLLDEPFPARLGVAACWPLGPISFFAVIVVLLLALPLARPLGGTLALLAIALLVFALVGLL